MAPHECLLQQLLLTVKLSPFLVLLYKKVFFFNLSMHCGHWTHWVWASLVFALFTNASRDPECSRGLIASTKVQLTGSVTRGHPRRDPMFPVSWGGRDGKVLSGLSFELGEDITNQCLIQLSWGMWDLSTIRWMSQQHWLGTRGNTRSAALCCIQRLIILTVDMNWSWGKCHSCGKHPAWYHYEGPQQLPGEPVNWPATVWLSLGIGMGHRSVSHLEKAGSAVRIMSFYLSSAFNTIQHFWGTGWSTEGWPTTSHHGSWTTSLSDHSMWGYRTVSLQRHECNVTTAWMSAVGKIVKCNTLLNCFWWFTTRLTYFKYLWNLD